MTKYIIILLLLFTSCSTNKVVKLHGTSLLDIKSKKLYINKTNQNDLIKILGPPSTKSSFDNKIWIYLERREVSTSVLKLGKKKLEKNNVLVVKLDDNGVLLKKDLFDITKMNNLNFSENMTRSGYQKDSYVYNLLTSLREKINSPIKRKRAAKDR